MLITVTSLVAFASLVKAFAVKVPAVSVMVELVVPAAVPPIVRVPTVAVPPVWVKRLTVLAIALSERPTIRMEVGRLKFPPLRLKVAELLALTPSMTPRVVLAKLVRVPPLKL